MSKTNETSWCANEGGLTIQMLHVMKNHALEEFFYKDMTPSRRAFDHFGLARAGSVPILLYLILTNFSITGYVLIIPLVYLVSVIFFGYAWLAVKLSRLLILNLCLKFAFPIIVYLVQITFSALVQDNIELIFWGACFCFLIIEYFGYRELYAKYLFEKQAEQIQNM